MRSSRVVFDRPGRLPNGAALWPFEHYGVFAEVEIVPVNPITRGCTVTSMRGILLWTKTELVSFSQTYWTQSHFYSTSNSVDMPFAKCGILDPGSRKKQIKP